MNAERVARCKEKKASNGMERVEIYVPISRKEELRSKFKKMSDKAVRDLAK